MSCRLLPIDLMRPGILCVLAVHVSVSSGCQVGRRWFQFDSDSGSPAMGIELRADAEAGEKPDDDQPDAGAELLPVDHVAPETRRGLADWLRLPRGDERIPLPTTSPSPGGDDLLPLTGPRPEFE